MDKCRKCASPEIEAMTPRTVYECASSDYDEREETFKQSELCKKIEFAKSVAQYVIDKRDSKLSSEELFNNIVDTIVNSNF